MRDTTKDTTRRLWPFLAGLCAGAAGIVIADALLSKRRFDVRLVNRSANDHDVPPVVLVPGVLGSSLFRPDGTQAWLNLGNAVGAHDLRLPFRLPLTDSKDDLVPAGLLGVDTVLPRLFGFTEYADAVDLLETAGFRRGFDRSGRPSPYEIFAYDWRRDLVESARRLGNALDRWAEALHDRDARFTLLGHSMGGLVARYYLRFGDAEPHSPVTWAGARRIHRLLLVATPNAGAIQSLETLLAGSRVGLSTATLSAAAVTGMPAIYQLLPPAGTNCLLDRRLEACPVDLHDSAAWERLGWGPFSSAAGAAAEPAADAEARRVFTRAALGRARDVHQALARRAERPCPVQVIAVGGDCLPTPARALFCDPPGTPPRFEPETQAEADAMLEAGDGRVTRASLLAAHVPGANESETGSGLQEIDQAFFGAADHHGIYSEPTFQSLLLRWFFRPVTSKARPSRRSLWSVRGA